MDIKKLKPKQRFSDLVDDYVKYRPGYPEGIIKILQNEYNLSGSSVIADIGSGTGKLSGLFLKNGNTVYAVEPNAEMRNAAEKIYAGNKNFISINASAEKTTLKDNCVDFIISGQAFHWFDRQITKHEFSRILKDNGFIALIWNKRDNTANIMKEYDRILLKYCSEYKKIGYDLYKESEIIKYFSPNKVSEYSISNNQMFSLDELIGRVRTTSYCPKENSKAFKSMMEELQIHFLKYKENEKIRFITNTVMFVSGHS